MLGVGVILVSFIICSMSFRGLWQILVAKIRIFRKKNYFWSHGWVVQVIFIDGMLGTELGIKAGKGSINWLG